MPWRSAEDDRGIRFAATPPVTKNILLQILARRQC
jgi:hypothetical protein